MEMHESRHKAVQETIRGNFDRGARGYAAFEEKNSFFSALLKGLLELSPLAPGAKILDVGCGTGASLSVLADKAGEAGRIVGLDLSLGMLKEAKKTCPDCALLVCMDGCAYGEALRPGFDAVVYNAVLFMLPDAESSLLSALKVLKPGGKVLVSNLDRIFLEGEPVPDLLKKEGFKVGKHALSPWPKVKGLLEELFSNLRWKMLEREISASLFTQFYGMEPMSAGLLPGMSYPKRRVIVEELGARCEREGQALTQRWVLAAAEKAAD